MTEEHARSLLGVDSNATGSEIANAYRRLMQTVHPDVCKGPEAERLAQQATDARKMLASTTTAHQDNDQEPVDKDWTLQEVVLHILDRTGDGTRIRILVANTIVMIKQLPRPETDAWTARLSESSFWLNGEVQGLWTIQGGRISRTSVKDGSDNSGQRNEDPSSKPRDDADVSEAWKTQQVTQFMIAAATEWIAGVAVTILFTLTVCMAAAAGANINAGDWQRAATLTIISFTAFKFLTVVKREIDFPDETLRDLHVLIPGISGGFLVTWGVLKGLAWIETALQ